MSKKTFRDKLPSVSKSRKTIKNNCFLWFPIHTFMTGGLITESSKCVISVHTIEMQNIADAYARVA